MKIAAAIIACMALAAVIAFAIHSSGRQPDIETKDLKATTTEHGADNELCPWRNPAADRQKFFPGATGSRDIDHILSRSLPELVKRLGRHAGIKDTLLATHEVYQGSMHVGTIIARRVRGQYGLIELILATDTHGQVQGAEIQRQREPDSEAVYLKSDKFLGAFHGKTVNSVWQCGVDMPTPPADARASAEALVADAKEALILLDIANRGDGSQRPS
jgi:hypothetical protein